jgi:ABC-type oligopeptide transport system substrate-binding subunit
MKNKLFALIVIIILVITALFFVISRSRTYETSSDDARYSNDPQHAEYLKYKAYYSSQSRNLPPYLACYVGCTTKDFQTYKLCVTKNNCDNID